MIEILTLFFGLYHGMQTVELAAGEAVAEVEVRLDGEPAGELEQPPWVVRIDLGDELEPHELIAVARDAGGSELGRARRWINLEAAPPTGQAPEPWGRGELTAVAITLGKGKKLPPKEGMHAWFSVDGEPLEVVRFDEGTAEVMIVRDPAVQGYLDRVTTFFIQLRLPISLEGDNVPLSGKEAFVAAARAVLLDRGDVTSAQLAAAVWERWNDHLDLGDDVEIRLVSPRAAPVSKIASRWQVLPFTPRLPSQEGGLLWHTAQIRPLHFVPRIADAVAMAGLEAHAGLRRRAVLLLLADEAMGPSRYPPQAVRQYLEDLQVPLFVWRFTGDGPLLERLSTNAPPPGETSGLAARLEDWRILRTLTYPESLEREKMEAYVLSVEDAAEELRDSLRRQRVVWLRGAHLPARIRLAAEAAGVAMAGAR